MIPISKALQLGNKDAAFNNIWASSRVIKPHSGKSLHTYQLKENQWIKIHKIKTKKKKHQNISEIERKKNTCV